MGLTLTTAPAAEPLTIAEVMTHLRLDASNQEPSPGAITIAMASPAMAGNVNAGEHRYCCTFGTSEGETEAGMISSMVYVVNPAINGKVELTDIPLGGAWVTHRKLYRTTAGGSIYLLLATLADNVTTTYTDNIADASLGAQAPTMNTTIDPMISGLIVGARRLAEKETGRVFLEQQWEQTFDAFPLGALVLSCPPLVSVESLKYVDAAGVQQTLSPSEYTVHTSAQVGFIAPAYGRCWPSARCQAEAVSVSFTAGYGVAASVPQEIKQWMLLHIAHWHENRAATANARLQPLPFIDTLLDAYRVSRFC